jgi:hypothetical protein
MTEEQLRTWSDDLDNVLLLLTQARWKLFDGRHIEEVEHIRDRLGDTVEFIEQLVQE